MNEKVIVYIKIENLHKNIFEKYNKKELEYPIQVIFNDNKYTFKDAYSFSLTKVHFFDYNKPIYKLNSRLYKNSLEKVFMILRQYSDHISYNELDTIIVDMSFSKGFFKDMYKTYNTIKSNIYNKTGFILEFGIGYDLYSAKYAYDSKMGVILNNKQIGNQYSDIEIKTIDVGIPQNLNKEIVFNEYIFEYSDLLQKYNEISMLLSDNLISYSLGFKSIYVELESINLTYKKDIHLNKHINSYNDFIKISEYLFKEINCNGYLDHPYISLKVVLSDIEIKTQKEYKNNEIYNYISNFKDIMVNNKKKLYRLKQSFLVNA